MSTFKDEIIDVIESFNRNLTPFVKLLDISDSCKNCGYFNANLEDTNFKYRCHTAGSCISATLNQNIVRRIWNVYEEQSLNKNEQSLRKELAESELLLKRQLASSNFMVDLYQININNKQ